MKQSPYNPGRFDQPISNIDFVNLPNHSMMALNDLRAGDVILKYDLDETDSAEHAYLWTVAGAGMPDDKPLVHCVESDICNGVFAQSHGPLIKEEDYSNAVFRCRNHELTRLVANYARRWAVKSNDMYFKQNVGQDCLRLRTPFSHDRLWGRNLPWNDHSLVRAVRAFVRADFYNLSLTEESAPVLSRNKGITCSQLVTYAYQAAGIGLVLSRDSYLRSLIMSMAGNEQFSFIKQRGLYGCIAWRLKPYEEILMREIPISFCVDAKTVDVVGMTRRLLKDPEFEQVGIITPPA